MVLKKIQDDEKVLVYLGQALVCEGIVVNVRYDRLRLSIRCNLDIVL